MAGRHDHDHTHDHTHDHEHEHAHDHVHASNSVPSDAPLEPHAGRGKVLYLDAGSGLAGDMLVAALLDLGVPEAAVRAGLSGLPLQGYRLQLRRAQRSSIAALSFEVLVDDTQPPRDYAQIKQLLTSASSLSDGARALALAAFSRLADAEARVHGVPKEQVHFHEVGAVDSIVDIVAAAISFDYLGARVVCSPLPMGRGMTRSAHGPIPLPAPATVLCLTDVPTYDAGIAEELVTPTGACLVASAASEFGGWPSFRPERTGFGAGQKEFADRPNVLRVVLGAPDTSSSMQGARGRHVVIESNVDDMSGEIAAHALSRALDAGALDAWATPIGMKKGRPAVLLSAVTERHQIEVVARALLSETTSLGVRYYAVDRFERSRRTVSVDTSFGPIVVKIADGDGLPENVAPEFESCRQAAERHGVAIRQVYAAAQFAYESARKTPARP